MSSSIERLPVEVFDIIADDLDLPALQNLRLSSRQLHLLTFSTFAKRHFSELTTTLGSASLDRLIHVANHRHLCHAVRVLDIRLLNHRDYKTLNTISRVAIFPPPKRFPKVSGVREEHITDEAITFDYVMKSKYPRRIYNQLVLALRRFCDLKVVRFRAKHAEPFGWRATVMPEGDCVFRSKCFQAVTDALLVSEVALEDFSMAKGMRTTSMSKGVNLPYSILQLSLPSLQALPHGFSSLRSLTLSIVVDDGNPRSPGWEDVLGHLIITAPRLKSLALSLDRGTNASRFSAAIIRSLSLSCRLQDLEVLRLLNCSLHEDHLAAFVSAHATSLRQVVFSDIRLVTGTWSSIWSTLKESSELECLRLASLEGTNNPVVFRKRGKEHPKIILDVEKDERTMSEMIDDLIAACDLWT
ncbi:hypothetical protein BDW02DRAFT_380564 [Decorospora gaudefroyi]|uniref:F-box domain-containing protein n=1 Tax=Decorospora gaudefroyi TaxID=184978 RepID=A0A6A5KB47_9PLEO|nr:hypothetical protein BDW02DRAFT_380564 [Decorospora gaudefroyi]